MDRAFESRTDLTLRYPDLSPEHRGRIWQQFITRAEPDNDLAEEMYARLAQFPLNGRQIKNAVKTSALLAAQKKGKLGLEHLVTVLRASGQMAKILDP